MEKGAAPRSRRPYLWAPAVVLAAFAAALIAGSLSAAWYTDRAAVVLRRLQLCLVWGSTALAALMLLPGVRTRVAAHIESLEDQTSAVRTLWLSAGWAGVFAACLFLKYCQYRGFQLPFDSSVTCNVAYNLLHRRSFECTLNGVPHYFAVHFIPLFVPLAALLWLKNSIVVFLTLQILCVASMPAAAYLLARRVSKSALAGAAAMWLVFCSPFFFHIVSGSIQPMTALAAFFLWGVFFAEAGWWAAACGMSVVMAATIEQAPLTFFGLGVYLVLRMGWRDRKSWLWGGAVCAGAALLFLVELKVIFSFPESARFRGWGMYQHLGGTPADALRAAGLHPLRFLRDLLWPLDKLAPLWRLLWTTGFAALLAPLQLIPFAVTYAPQLLASPGDFYHQLTLHYSSYCIGPFWWAAATGTGRAHAWLAKRGGQAWLLLPVLLVGAMGLWSSPAFLGRKWYEDHFKTAPEAIALVPEQASLWANEYLTPWVSCRSFIKAVPYQEEWTFTERLFKPDYMLLTKYWILKSDPGFRRKIVQVIVEEGYEKALESEVFVLLRHPGAPLRSGAGRPPAMALPPGKEELDFRVTKVDGAQGARP